MSEKDLNSISENENLSAMAQPIKKARNNKSLIIIIVAALVLFASGLVYFIQMENVLESKLEAEDYVSAGSTAKLMPWLFATNPQLNNYLSAQFAFANGDAETAAKLLKNIGGYRDASDLYLKAEIVSRLKTISSSSNADELVAALKKLDDIDLVGTAYSELVNNLYATSYDKALAIIIEDVNRSKTLLELLPTNYLQASTKLQIANIYYDFHTKDIATIYEDTYENLRAFISDETAKTLLTSKYFIPMYLSGKWETTDGKYYFEQTNISLQDGTGTHKTNLPKEGKFVAADYDDGAMYAMLEGSEVAELVFSFECVDMNTIKIENCFDSKIYELIRKG